MLRGKARVAARRVLDYIEYVRAAASSGAARAARAQPTCVFRNTRNFEGSRTTRSCEAPLSLSRMRRRLTQLVSPRGTIAHEPSALALAGRRTRHNVIAPCNQGDAPGTVPCPLRQGEAAAAAHCPAGAGSSRKTFHTSTAPSSPTVTSCRPSGENCSFRTGPEWPVALARTP